LRNIRANSIRVYNSLIGDMTGDEVWG
jgi:hypothetical protein